MFIFALGNSSDAFLLLRARDAGIPASHLPLLWMALHLVKAASSYPAGVLSDKLGRRGLITGGWCVYALVYVGFARAEAAWQIWALFVAYGLFYGMTESAERALVADFYPDAQRGRAFGAFHFITGIAALPASLLMGLLWERAGPGAAFTCGAVLALGAAAWLAFTPRPPAAHTA
jgi:MFS family permease